MTVDVCVMDHRNRTHIPGQKNSRRKLLCASAAGFTLLELLISMTLVVVIIVLLMGAMRIGARSVAGGEKKIEAEERFRTVISLIDAQIQSQVPLTYQEDGNEKYYFRGDGKTLRFSTNYSIWGGQRGYVIVDYRVESDNSGKEIIFASESVPGVEGRRDTRLLEASSISFEYYWKDPSEEQGIWVDSLIEGAAIPEQIRINLLTGTKKLSLLFPVRVGGKLMAVQGGKPIGATAAKSAPIPAK